MYQPAAPGGGQIGVGESGAAEEGNPPVYQPAAPGGDPAGGSGGVAAADVNAAVVFDFNAGGEEAGVAPSAERPGDAPIGPRREAYYVNNWTSGRQWGRDELLPDKMSRSFPLKTETSTFKGTAWIYRLERARNAHVMWELIYVQNELFGNISKQWIKGRFPAWQTLCCSMGLTPSAIQRGQEGYKALCRVNKVPVNSQIT